MGPRHEFKERVFKRRDKTQGCASKDSSAHNGDKWGKVAVDEGSITEGTTLHQSAGIRKGTTVVARQERDKRGMRRARGRHTVREQGDDRRVVPQKREYGREEGNEETKRGRTGHTALSQGLSEAVEVGQREREGQQAWHALCREGIRQKSGLKVACLPAKARGGIYVQLVQQ